MSLRSIGMPRSESATITELDLELVEALQVDPRAPWRRIGAVIGVDATTAARRWERLTSAGLAWLTAYPTAPTLVVGYLDIACAPAHVDDLTDWLCAQRCVFTVERQTGKYQLTVGVDACDIASFDSFITERIGVLSGIDAIRSMLGIRHYREGSGWQVRALSTRQRALLDDTASQARLRTPPRWDDDAIRTMLHALGADGRRNCADIARDTGMDESTVRRRISRMLRLHEVEFRCDFANAVAGWPIIANYSLETRGAHLDAVGGVIAAQPETRWCAAVTGEHNMRVSAWLHTPEDSVDFEARLTRLVPQVRVVERNLTTRMPKRMGRLLDESGVAIGQVPITPMAAGKAADEPDRLLG